MKNKMRIGIPLILAIVLVFIAGCTQAPQNVPNPSQNSAASGLPGQDTQTNQQTPEVVPMISLTNVPQTITAGQTVKISWKVDSSSPLIAVHTAVHYDKISHPGVFTTDDSVQSSGYPTFTQEYASGQYAIPGTFTGIVTVPSDATMLYLRAHAIIGGQNYWTGEVAIPVMQNTQATQPVTQPQVTSQPETYNVMMQNYAFSPATLNIHVGDTVVWTNQDSAPHTVDSMSGNELSSGRLSQGETYSHTFVKPGTYAYYCAVHPYMKATIIVSSIG